MVYNVREELAGPRAVACSPVIESVETFVVRQTLEPSDHFEYSQSAYRDRTILLCRVTADDGTVGWGEAFGPAVVHKATIDTVYTPIVVGRSVFEIDVIWEALYNSLRDHGQKGLAIEAISAIDIALWDLLGHLFGLRAPALMGGAARERVLAYATGFYRRPNDRSLDWLAREAEATAARGYRALKIKIGFGFEYDLAAVETVREAVGNDVEIMVDANHAYNASTAIRLGRHLERLRIAWFEEPVPPEDIGGYREVKDALTIPVAGGEAEFTRYGFANLLSARAVDILQPDCTITGGISEFRKIATLASISNVQVYPHVWGSAIAVHAALSCALTLPEYPPRLYPQDVYFEVDQTPNIFRDELNGGPISVVDGYVEAPSGPGLGVQVSLDLIDRHRIA
jgi:D-galactarolactone cycloisomerase